MNYEFAYRIGFHPWEDAERHLRSPRRSRSCSPRRKADVSRRTDLPSMSGLAAGPGGFNWPSGAGRSRVLTSSRKLCGARKTGSRAPV